MILRLGILGMGDVKHFKVKQAGLTGRLHSQPQLIAPIAEMRQEKPVAVAIKNGKLLPKLLRDDRAVRGDVISHLKRQRLAPRLDAPCSLEAAKNAEHFFRVVRPGRQSAKQKAQAN